VKWLVIGLGTGSISGLAGTIIGFWANNLVYGLVIGVVLGMLLLGGFAVKAISIAAAGAPPTLPAANKGERSASREASEARIRRLETENGALHEQIERLTSERDELLERLQTQSEPPEHQPGDEDRKQRSLALADELYQFLEDHDVDEVSDPLDPEVRRRDEAIMRQYRRRFGGRVVALLEELKARGWWKPEALDEKKRRRIEDPGFPTDIQDVAQYLSAIGHRS
jgi:cell division protein FtsN